MAELKYKTRANSTPQGKPRVYFACHPDDFEKYFDSISDEVLSRQNCAMYYLEPGSEFSDEIYDLVSQMQLIVIPVTLKLLQKNNSDFDKVFDLAMSHHIPVLPLMQEMHLEKLFNRKCGNLQYLCKYSNDATAISYEKKLTMFLQKVLISDELAEKVRAAFDAYIFLSYRKKDRKYAKQLMHLIHKNEFCRDIAIWYDEFLVPGEDFNDAIAEALQKSKLFAMVVTPNLVTEQNYVMNNEYPMARDRSMTILPVESVATNREQLEEKFEGIPPCTDAEDEKLLADALRRAIEHTALSQQNASPEHKYFMGLAYLDGIDVEVNHELGAQLIHSAATENLPEAIEMLIGMYFNGIGVERDYKTAVEWMERLRDIYVEKFKSTGDNADAKKLYFACADLAEYYRTLADYPKAAACASSLINDENLKNHLDMEYHADMYDSLALVQFYCHDYKNALPNHKKAVEIYEELLSKNPDNIDYKYEIARCSNNMTMSYLEAGSHSELNKLYGKIESILESLYGDFPEKYAVDLVKTYNNHGIFLMKKQKYSNAEQMFSRALDILRKLDPSECAAYYNEVAMIYFNTGTLYSKMKHYSNSEDMYTGAIELLNGLYASDPDVYALSLSNCYNSLGKVYTDTKCFDKAEKLFADAIAIREEYYEKNPEVFCEILAVSYNDLGYVYHETGHHDKAKIIYEKNVSNLKDSPLRKNFEGNNPLAVAYAQLALISEESGDNERSLELYDKAIAIAEDDYENALAKAVNDLVPIYNNAGWLYYKTENYLKALDVCLKELKFLLNSGKQDIEDYTSKLGQCYRNIASTYMSMKEYEKSEKYYTLALDELKKTVRKNSKESGSVLSDIYGGLGALNLRNGKYPKAERMLTKAIELTEQLNKLHPGKYSSNLSSYYSMASTLYERMGDPNKARKMQSKKNAALKN